MISLTPFNNEPKSSRNLIIQVRSFILSFDTINVVFFGAEDEAKEEEWQR